MADLRTRNQTFQLHFPPYNLDLMKTEQFYESFDEDEDGEKDEDGDDDSF